MYSLLLLCIGISAISVACLAEKAEIKFDCDDAREPIQIMDPGKPYKKWSNIQAEIRHSIHQALVAKLIEKCEAFYDFQPLPYELFTDMDTSFKAFGNSLFINLFVQDYNVAAADEIDASNEIYCAGAVIVEKDIDVHIIDSDVIKSSCGTYPVNDSCIHTKESCDKKWTTDKITVTETGFMIMNERLTKINSGDLLGFISSLKFSGSEVQSRENCLGVAESAADLKTVLICIDDKSCFNKKKPNEYDLNLVLVDTTECEKFIQMYNGNLLAVLTPRPFEMDDVFSVPTLFYNIPYMNPEYYTQFPNSFNLVSGKVLPYAFLRFIQSFEWRRVAIISDDTPYSKEFESDLLRLFHKERIISNVQRCERHCNFEKALKNLSHMDARIIVANVDEMNAGHLARAVNNYSKFTLLYRVHAYEPRDTKRSVSITLGPETLNYKSCDGCEDAVLNGINVIVQAFNAISDDRKTSITKKKYYRLFKDEAENLNTNDVYIAKVTRPGSSETLSTMKIDSSGVIISFDEFEKPFVTPPVAEIPCYTKTNNFEKPCDISLSLLFMFIVISFCISILMISCYFDNTSPIHARRYQQF